jgi:predicted nucleotidyltransferase
MAVKTVSRKKQNGASAQPPSLPDLAWYRDAANGRKRNAHIKRLCAAIAREFHPQKIILFGSQAHGNPTVESDIDLLVVMPYEGSPFRQAGEILKRLQVWMPVDLIVRDAEEVQQRLEIGDNFMQGILEQGKVMYKTTDGRMGAEG